MKPIYRIISFVLCCVMVFSLCACSVENASDGQASINPPSNTDFWGKPNDSSSDSGNAWDADLTPDINVTIIGGGQKEDNIGSEIDAGIIDSIYSLVSSAVTKDLEEDGFSCGIGVATTVDNDNIADWVSIIQVRIFKYLILLPELNA